MLKIGGGEQVMLKVRVAEVQREVAKQLGVDVTSAMKLSGVPIIAATSNPYGLVGRALADHVGCSDRQHRPGSAQSRRPTTSRA